MSDGLRRLLDIEEIRAAKARYGLLVDGFVRAVRPVDVEAFAALFTEDLVAEFDGLGRFEGRAAVVEVLSVVTPTLCRWMWHSFHSPVIEIDGDRAEARWTLWSMAKADPADPRPTVTAGRYVDGHVRTLDGWRQNRLRFTVEAVYPA